MAGFLQDLKFALRSLIKDRGFAAVAALTTASLLRRDRGA